jgi:hypothetical protein
MSDTPLTVAGSMPQGLKKSRPMRPESETVAWSTLNGSLALHVKSQTAPNFWLELNLTPEFLRARLAELEGATGPTTTGGL